MLPQFIDDARFAKTGPSRDYVNVIHIFHPSTLKNPIDNLALEISSYFSPTHLRKDPAADNAV